MSTIEDEFPRSDGKAKFLVPRTKSFLTKRPESADPLEPQAAASPSRLT